MMKKTGPTLKQTVTVLRMLDAIKQFDADNESVSAGDHDAIEALAEPSGALLRAVAGQHTSNPLSLINGELDCNIIAMWRGG